MLNLEEVVQVEHELGDLYVWEYDAEEYTIFITYNVTASARIRCRREVYEDNGPYEPPFFAVEREPLLADAHLSVEIAASIRGGAIVSLAVESVDRG
jgi:hypothetical protein